MSDHLWAPWRFDYVSQADESNKSGCVFCDMTQKSVDRDQLILHRDDEVFVVLNAYPYTSGHLMVMPYRHVAKIGEMTDSELLQINQNLVRAVSWIEKVMKPDGYNFGVNMGRAAGAGIPGHIHWHVVPRWDGDTNFMTAIGNVRVIPQDLRMTWDLLVEAKEKT